MATAVEAPTYVLTEATQKIFKNFAGISTGILLKEGTTQKTVSPSKSVLAIAELPEAWPQETAVFQLDHLLANISAYDRPRLEFAEDHFILSGASSPSRVVFPYSDPSTVAPPPNKEFDLTNPAAQFTLPPSVVAEIKKFSQINQLPTIQIQVDAKNGTIVVKPYDEKNPHTRSYSFPVHYDLSLITSLSSTETVMFKREHFDLIMDGGYTISVGSWPYLNLKHQTEAVSYLFSRMAK